MEVPQAGDATGEEVMEVMYPRCAGLDVHKESVVACVRIVAGGEVSRSVRTFATTTTVETRQHLLRDNVPCPAWNRGTEIDVPPLWMTGCNQELVPICKQPFSKAFDSAVSVATPWPVEHGKNCWYCDGLDLLSFCNKRWVVFRLELTHRVIVGKDFGVRNRNEV